MADQGELPCQDCGGRNPVWFADNDLWNAVMGGEAGMLCPNCFMQYAEVEEKSPPVWRVTAGYGADPVYVVHTPRGWTETFDLRAVETLERLGLIRHERDGYALEDGAGNGVGPLHRYYREADPQLPARDYCPMCEADVFCPTHGDGMAS